MKKIITLILTVLLTFFVVGCTEKQSYQPNINENQQNNYENDTVSETISEVEEIALTTDNISDYLKIDVSYEDISVTKSNAFNPPKDKGTGKIVVKTTALKRGDFENVNIVLLFKSERGWDPTTVRIMLPFDGNITETKELLSYNSLVFDNPRYEMTVSSVSGTFVK